MLSVSLGASEREHGVRWLGGGLKGWMEAADWLEDCFFFQTRRRRRRNTQVDVSLLMFRAKGNILDNRSGR